MPETSDSTISQAAFERACDELLRTENFYSRMLFSSQLIGQLAQAAGIPDSMLTSPWSYIALSRACCDDTIESIQSRLPHKINVQEVLCHYCDAAYQVLDMYGDDFPFGRKDVHMAVSNTIAELAKKLNEVTAPFSFGLPRNRQVVVLHRSLVMVEKSNHGNGFARES